MTRRLGLLALLLGAGIFTALLAWQGFGTVARSFSTAGWGVLWVLPLFLLPGWMASESWRVLFPAGRRPPPLFSGYATWAGLGINWLLPVAMVGGEIVKVRLADRRGFPVPGTLATVVVDKTFQAATTVPYALLGLTVLALASGEGPGRIPALLLGAAGLTVGIWLFWRLQLEGVFERLAGFADRFLPFLAEQGLEAGAREVDRAIREIYGDRERYLPSLLWRFGFRGVLAIETIVVMALLDHPVGLGAAVALESLVQAARAASFMVPGGLGAQEGGLVLVGAALGIPPETALALSLAKRVRELGVGLPALAAWQIEEGWSALRRT